jgi:fluoride exporter
VHLRWLGGFLGADSRYLLGLWIVDRVGTAFPWHTWLINVSGSLAIGLVLTLLTERVLSDPVWRLFLVVGFLGGYTTFSSYTMEVITLLSEGEWVAALGYVVGSNAIGLLATSSGILLARVLWR